MTEIARLESHISVTGAAAAQRTLRDWDQQSARTAKSAQEGFDKAGKSAGGYGSSLKTVTATAAGFAVAQVGVTSATAAAELAFKSTIVAAAGYQRQMKVLEAQSGATAQQMKQVDARAKELGADLTLPGVSAKDASASMLELSRAGLTLNDTMTAAKGTLALAAAGQLENARAAEITANALNSFGLSGDQAIRVADLLAAAANASSANVDQLAQGMQQASAVFNGANQPIEALVTSMALMSKAGIQGSDAGTSLKTAMLRLQAPVDKAADTIATYNIQTRDSAGAMLPMPRLIDEFTTKIGGLEKAERDAALASIFGQDAIRAGLIVFTAGSKAYDDMAANVTKAGAAQKMAAAQMDGLSGAVAGLQSQIETLALEAGEKALPILEGAIRGVSSGLESAQFQLFTDGLAGMGGVIASTVELFQMLPPALQLTAVGFLAAAAAAAIFMANPVVATVAATSLALILLIGKLEQARQEHLYLTSATQEYAAASSALATQAAPQVSAALKTIETAGGGAAEKLSHLRTEHQSLGTAADQLYAKMVKLAEPFGGNMEKARQSSKEFAALENRWLSNTATMGVLEAEAQKMGAGLEYAAGRGSVLSGSMNDAAVATANAGAAATKLDPLKQGITDITKNAEDATKALRDLLAPPSGTEQALVGQIASITSAQESLGAATKTAGDEKAYWISKAREMLANAGLEQQAFRTASKVIDDYAKGNIDAATATQRMTDALKPSIERMQAIVDAEGSVRDAVGKTLEAQQNAERGWSTSLDAQIKKASEWKDLVTGTFDEATLAAEQTAKDVNTAAGEIFGPPVQAAVSANVQKTMGGAAEEMRAGVYIAKTTGGEFGAGFAGGIASPENVAAAAGAARTVAGAANEAFRSELEIRSPSRVTMQYGEWTAEGLAVGILNEQGQVVAAVRVLTHEAFAGVEASVNSFNANLQNANPGLIAYAASLGILQHDVSALGEAVDDTDRSVATFATTAQAAGAGFAALTAPAKQNTVDIANLDKAIAKLNLELAHTEPLSAREAAIKADIQTLTAWRGQVQAGIAVLDAEKAALEANKTALEGATEARTAMLARQESTTRLGASGAEVRGGLNAAGEENTAESGRTAVASLEAFIEGLRTKLGPRFQETAKYLRFLFWQELGAVTDADRAAARARLDQAMGELQADATAAMTLTAQTANSALTAALFDSATVSAIGARAAQIRRGMAEALRLSGTPEFAEALAGVTQSIAAYEAEFGTLPVSLRGPLLEQYRAAYRAWAATPNDPEAQAALTAAVTRTEQALAVLPQNLDRLRPEVRDAAIRLFGEVEAGVLTVEQARERVEGIVQLIPADIYRQAPEAQAAARQLAQAVEAGLIPAEEAIERLNGFTRTIGTNLREQTPQAQADIRRMAGSFLDLETSVESASVAADRGLERIADAATAAAAVADPALRQIDLAIQQLIASFQAGAVSAEEFAAAMSRLQSAAAAASAASRSGAGTGAGGGGTGAGGGGDEGQWIRSMLASTNTFRAPAALGVGGIATGGGDPPPPGARGGGAGMQSVAQQSPLLSSTSSMIGPGVESGIKTLAGEQKETNEWLAAILEALREAGITINPDDIARAGYKGGTARAMQFDLGGRF